ncbi:MAG: hypothetical protein JWN76_1366 [Chitinophagaceae bacterium]|nr:hypothetical protein [Chitinophagaceae bacterium]
MIEFFNHLNSLQPLSSEAVAALLKIIKAKELRRGQVWLQEGAVCDKMTFVVKGLLKLYFETGSKEVILSFAREGEFMVSAQSYFGQVPSHYTIRSVEQTVLVYILRSDMQGALEKHPELNMHLSLIARQQAAAHEYHTALLMLSRQARFEKVAADHPWMVNGRLLSDRMLAGWLGITPNCLSSFRRAQ